MKPRVKAKYLTKPLNRSGTFGVRTMANKAYSPKNASQGYKNGSYSPAVREASYFSCRNASVWRYNETYVWLISR